MNKLLLSLLLASSSALAVDRNDYINPYEFNIMGPLQYKDSYLMKISGNFDKDSYEKIKAALDKTDHKPVYIYAESFGGYANDIMKTAELIHDQGNVIWKVEEGSYCMSTCAMVALGSKKIEGILHFHAITFDSNNQIDINLTNKIIANFYKYKPTVNLEDVMSSKKLRHVKFS